MPHRCTSKGPRRGLTSSIEVDRRVSYKRNYVTDGVTTRTQRASSNAKSRRRKNARATAELARFAFRAGRRAPGAPAGRAPRVEFTPHGFGPPYPRTYYLSRVVDRRTACYSNAVECCARLLLAHLWFPLSARPPPALCPQSHVLWSPRTQHDYSILFSPSAQSTALSCPSTPSDHEHEPNLASEGRYVPRCGAGLGRPDWGQIGARLGLARFGFGRPPRQQAWVAAQ